MIDSRRSSSIATCCCWLLSSFLVLSCCLVISTSNTVPQRTAAAVSFVVDGYQIVAPASSPIIRSRWRGTLLATGSIAPTALYSNKSYRTGRSLSLGAAVSSRIAETTATTTTSTTASSMRYVENIRAIVDDYDIFLIDMWGVMHDGSTPYQGVLDVVEQLARNDKALIILSNSSKRQSHSLAMLTKLGFDPAHFQQVVTSGEVAYQLLTEHNDKTRNSDSAFVSPDETTNASTATTASTGAAAWLRDALSSSSNHINNNNVFIYGSGAADDEYCRSMGLEPVARMEDAALIVARGTFTIPSQHQQQQQQQDSTGRTTDVDVIDKRLDNKSEELYNELLESTLRQAAQRRIPMLVTNPDKVRPDEGLPPMPGAIGDRYEQILLAEHQQTQATAVDDKRKNHQLATNNLVKRIGKPFEDVYEIALRNCDNNNNNKSDERKSRICMIGDALETDIVGGSRAGITTIWVVGDGIHGPDIRQRQQDSKSGDGEESSSLLRAATTVVGEFNQRKDHTYAKGLAISPDILMPHFRW